MSATGAGCPGLETEAVVAGRLVRVSKHSPLIEAYGCLEEAEALLARARLGLRKRGELGLARRLARLQHVVRLLPGFLAGSVDADKLASMVEEAVEGLEEPRGWSLTGCSPEDPDVVMASVKVRAAERNISRAAEEGVVPAHLASAFSRLASAVAYALYAIHWALCRGNGARTTRELVVRSPPEPV